MCIRDRFSSDNEGLELNRQTITGEYDDYFKVLIEQAEGRHLSNEEYFPKYIKAHIDRGAILLESHYKHAGDLDKYVLETLEMCIRDRAWTATATLTAYQI